MLLLALNACSSQRLLDSERERVELGTVPFFAQERFQCGPAALAMVLTDRNVEVSPEELVSQVYVPGRKGSFQAELKAATRSYGLLPYEPHPTLAAIYAELSAGRPVLVLQNLYFDWYPKWHYAVVVGIEPERNRIILRSGITERMTMTLPRFKSTWDRASNWAMIVLPPGELPAMPDVRQYLRVLADSEQRISEAAYEQALTTALQTWPESANAWFLGGNHARLTGRPELALSRYQRALDLEPQHAGARNNLVDLMLSHDCVAEAGIAAQPLRIQAIADPVIEKAVIATLVELDAAVNSLATPSACSIMEHEALGTTGS